MTLALICQHYRISWADTRTLRLWEVKALADHLNETNRRQAEANKPRR